MAERVLFLLVTCIGLAGCVVIPQPRDVVQLSPVDGRISRDGHPLTGVPLTMNSLHETAPCEQPIARVVTDANGAFAFAEITARKTWRTVVLAPSSPTFAMTLCMETDAGPTPIFAERIWATLPITLTLHCDLGAAEGAREACEVSDWTGYNFLSRSDAYYGDYRAPAGPPSDAARE